MLPLWTTNRSFEQCNVCIVDCSKYNIIIWRPIIVNQYNCNISTFSANTVTHKKWLFRVTSNLFILPDALNFRHQNPQCKRQRFRYNIFISILQQNKQINPFQFIFYGKMSLNENSTKWRYCLGMATKQEDVTNMFL